MNEYYAGMAAGEALIIAEVEQMAKAAETPQEQEVLFSLLDHLTLKEMES